MGNRFRPRFNKASVESVSCILNLCFVSIFFGGEGVCGEGWLRVTYFMMECTASDCHTLSQGGRD